VPRAAPVDVVIVKLDMGLELPEGMTEVGLRLQVTPLPPGSQVSATALLKPFNAAMVTVEVAEFPGGTVAGEAGVAEI
jgi:hypothetical protein